MSQVRDDIAAGKASFNVSSANLFNAAIGAVFFAILPRILTSPELGVLATVTVSYTILQQFGQFGMNRSAASLVSGSLVEGNEAAGRVVWDIIFLSIIFSVIAIVPAYVFAPQLSDLAFKNTTGLQAFELAAIIVFWNSLASNFEGIVAGMREFPLLAKSRVIAQVLRIAVSLSLLFIGLRVSAILIGLFFGQYGIATIAIQFPKIRRKFQFVFPRVKDLREIIRYSFPLFGYTLMFVLSGQLDLLILIVYANVAVVGVYSIAQVFAQSVMLAFVLPIQAALIPYMAKIMKERGTLEPALAKASRLVSMVALPTTAALASTSPLIVFLIAGPNYLRASFPLAIMMVATILQVFAVLFSAALQAYGRNNAIFASIGVGLLSEAVAGFFLVPILGPTGAAACRIALYAAWFAAAALVLRSVMTVKIDTRSVFRMAIASCSFFVVPLSYLIWRNMILLVVSMIFAILIFLVLLKFVRAIRPSDVKVVLGSFPDRFDILFYWFRIYKLANWLTE